MSCVVCPCRLLLLAGCVLDTWIAVCGLWKYYFWSCVAEILCACDWCVELLLVELVGLLLLVLECRALALGKGEKRASVCEL